MHLNLVHLMQTSQAIVPFIMRGPNWKKATNPMRLKNAG